MKTCIKCGEEKGIVDFAYNGMNVDQLNDVCKVCKGEVVAQVASVEPVVAEVPAAMPVPEVVVEAPVNDVPVKAAPKRVVKKAAPVVEEDPVVDPSIAGVVAATEVTPIEPPPNEA